MSLTTIPGSHTSDGNEQTPLKSLFLNTTYWTFSWNFNEMNIDDCIESEHYSFPELECEFYFKVHKTTSTSVAIELHRVLKDPKERPDDGFILHLTLSVIGLRRQPKNEYMNSSTDVLMISYDVSAIPPDKMNNCCWVVKCGFEMCEMTNLENEAFRNQNKLLEKIIKRKKNSMRKLAATAYLLNCLEFDSVFSGRQTCEFAKGKAELIERTVEFADEILASFFARAVVSPVPHQRGTPLGVILNYIHKKKSGCIGSLEILPLYSMAHRYGLLYLELECIEYMEDNLQEIDFLLNVLVFCDVLCDNSSLMYNALVQLLQRRNEIFQSAIWQKLANERCPVLRSIIQTLMCEMEETERSPLQQAEELPKSVSMEEEIETALKKMADSAKAINNLQAKIKQKRKNKKR